MNILMFLIPVSMLFLGLAIWAFVWAVKGRQFENLEASALDILREDEHDRPLPPGPVPPTAAAGDDAQRSGTAPREGGGKA